VFILYWFTLPELNIGKCVPVVKTRTMKQHAGRGNRGTPHTRVEIPESGGLTNLEDMIEVPP